eukprot:4524522-Prymnesium_polylepis.2
MSVSTARSGCASSGSGTPKRFTAPELRRVGLFFRRSPVSSLGVLVSPETSAAAGVSAMPCGVSVTTSLPSSSDATPRLS